MSYKYLARQPIVDLNGKLFAYEMLYRNSEDNFYPQGVDDDVSTRAMISNMQTDFDLKSVTGGKRAFINLTRQMCMSDIVLLLKPDEVVIEILESAWVDEAFLHQIQSLREKGYIFALDDYIGQKEFDALLPFVDFIKVDFIQLSMDMRRTIANRLRGKKLLAEKVEDEEDQRQARVFGYELAQGYYFSRPVVLKAETIGISTVTHLNLWKEINRTEPRYNEMADIILRDAGMTLRLFKKAGTLQYFRGGKIDSVLHALVRMGAQELKRWTMLILLQECLSGQNDEYIRLALSRAEYLERLAKETGYGEYAGDAYITGMFSVFDATEPEVVEKLIEQMNLNETISDALLHYGGFIGEMLAFVHDYESGHTDSTEQISQSYGIKPERIVELYKSAMEYADQTFQSVV